HWVTFSPSSSSCSRSTPCVDGCEGPIESDILSPCSSAAASAVRLAASGTENSVGMGEGGGLRRWALGGSCAAIGGVARETASHVGSFRLLVRLWNLL